MNRSNGIIKMSFKPLKKVNVKELKEKADRITVANTEDAIAKIISQL